MRVFVLEDPITGWVESEGPALPPPPPRVLEQDWLHQAYAIIRQELVPEAPENPVVSYGFPKGGTGRAIGQCWHTPDMKGKMAAAIFIHPTQWKTPLDVLHVLVHETIHAAYIGDGHRGQFPKVCRRVGLAAPWIATTPGEELKEKLATIARRLPTMPRSDFDGSRRKGGGSRLRLWECACLPKPIKLRVARDDLDVTCNLCESEFVQQGEKVEPPARKAAATRR